MLLYVSTMAHVLFTDDNIHLGGFGFVFPIEELWKGSTLNGMNAAVKETEYNDARDLKCVNFNFLVFCHKN